MVDHGTMRAAASRCHVSQPALSRSIRSLEAELGAVLLERRGRNVALTTTGREIAEIARRIGADAVAIERVAQHDRQTLTVCATATFEAVLTEIAVPGFLRRRPTARLQMVHAASSDDVESRIRSGHAELGLLDREPSADLVSVCLGTGDVVLLSPPALDLPDPVPAERLDRIPLILPAAGSPRRVDCERLFAALGVDPPVVLESDERSAWVRAVAAGIGSSLSFSWPGGRGPDADVVLRRFDPPVRVALHLVHGGGRLSPAAETFLDAALHDAVTS